MWNFKSTKPKTLNPPPTFRPQAVGVVEATSQDVNALVEQIHKEFDDATEKILNDSLSSLRSLEEKDTDKGERLGKLGFSNAKTVKEALSVRYSKNHLKMLSEKVMYYQTHYPNSKFITEDVVKKICEKYKLVLGDASVYIGDVPEKNISEMEKFSLRRDEYSRYQLQGGDGQNKYYYAPAAWSGRHEMHSVHDDDKSVDIEDGCIVRKEPFKICAPLKDFDTSYMKIEDGYNLKMNLPDPVVLQPVPYGYLIVTKWGLEGNDESLVNEKLN